MKSPIHLSKKTLALLYRMAILYLLLLGFLNIASVLARPALEKAIKKALNARTVSIGYVSNVPFVFASVDKLKVTINDDLEFEINNLYFRYRLLKLFTKEFELFPASFSIDKIYVLFHTSELKTYLKGLSEKYQFKETSQKSSDTKAFTLDPNVMYLSVSIKNLGLTIRSMTHYRTYLDINNNHIDFRRGSVDWAGDVNLHTVWSNQVHLFTVSTKSMGSFTNLFNPSGTFTIGVNNLNLGGIPIIDQFLSMNFSLSNQELTFDAFSTEKNAAKSNIVLEGGLDSFTLKIDKTFDINYKEFEEYEMLDYAFNPGKYSIHLMLDKKDDWNARFILDSLSDPGYGIDASLIAKGNGVYGLPLFVKTRFFGSLMGDLALEGRKGLYPLPSGKLILDNVRFLLSGLVFSGDTIVKAMPGKNNIDITAFNVEMNGGLIGNTRVDLGIYDAGRLLIKPLPFSNDVEVFVDVLDSEVDILLKANSLSGNFLKENTKLAVFGLDTSIYKGILTLNKTNRKDFLIMKGSMLGFMDEEKQIEIEIEMTNDIIVVPRLFFVSQNLLLSGSTEIKGTHTNTSIDINAQAQLGTNELIPINLNVLVEKNTALVRGFVDDTVPLLVESKGADAAFSLNFEDYSLQKLGLNGTVSGNLLFGFDTHGWTRFGFEKGLLNMGGRLITLDFNSSGEQNQLPLEYFRIGLDTEILDGIGYIDFRDGIGGAIHFSRGGGLQFIVGNYTLKSVIELHEFMIEDFLNIPALEAFKVLQDPSTETIYADIKLNVNGMFSNPDIKGSINLKGSGDDRGGDTAFQMVVGDFSKSGDIVSLTNMRLRHPQYNADGDIYFKSNEKGGFFANLSGAFALGNLLKTGVNVSVSKEDENAVFTYDIPNLYAFSRAPMSMSGKIIQQGDRLLMLSDNPKFGITGYFEQRNQNTDWNLLFQSDALRLVSEGIASDTFLDGFIYGKVDLKKLNLGGGIRKLQGSSEIHIIASGIPDNPILNGSITFNNIILSLNSLRNKLNVPYRNVIRIENNKVIIPPTPILTGGNNVFDFSGTVDIQDKSIENIDLNLVSRSGDGNSASTLKWRLNVPFVSISGLTSIDYIRFKGSGDNISVASSILAKNLNISLELQDLAGIGVDTRSNPMTALLEVMNFDISLMFGTGVRLLNNSFDFRFEQNQKLALTGSVGAGSLAIAGEMPIQSGSITYLGKYLKIETGTLAFSGEANDPFPTIRVDTATTEKDIYGDLVSIYVGFLGKLPDIELANISAIPARSRSEIFGLLGFGGTTVAAKDSVNQLSSSQAAVASSVGLAENAFFIAPLTQRLRKTFGGIIDTLQVKTDILGNLTRSFALGSAVTGLALLNGSEIEIGKNLPNITGLQVRYNLRLENPPNTPIESVGQYLDQIHKLGIQWDYRTPQLWQIVLGGSFGASVDGDPQSSSGGGKPENSTGTVYEFIGEVGFKKRF